MYTHIFTFRKRNTESQKQWESQNVFTLWDEKFNYAKIS